MEDVIHSGTRRVGRPVARITRKPAPEHVQLLQLTHRNDTNDANDYKLLEKEKFYKLHAELIINTTHYNNNGTMSGERTIGRLERWPALSQITHRIAKTYFKSR